MLNNSGQNQALDLLGKTRLALMAGELQALENLVQKTTELTLQLARLPPDARFLSALSTAAGRNLLLLQAARNGLSDAVARRRVLQDGAAALRTYNRNGELKGIPQSQRHLEQKS